jgi:hypothetical protein
VESAEKRSAVKTVTASADGADKIALAAAPEVGKVRLDRVRLLGVPRCGAGVTETRGELCTFSEGALLHHVVEEMLPLNLFPEVEAVHLPVVGDVFEVVLDDRLGRIWYSFSTSPTTAYRLGDSQALSYSLLVTYDVSPASSSIFANLIKTVARIAGPSFCGRPQPPLHLRQLTPSRRPRKNVRVRSTVDKKLRLSDSSSLVAAGGIIRTLELVTLGGEITQERVQRRVAVDILVQEIFEDDRGVTGPLVIAICRQPKNLTIAGSGIILIRT